MAPAPGVVRAEHEALVPPLDVLLHHRRRPHHVRAGEVREREAERRAQAHVVAPEPVRVGPAGHALLEEERAAVQPLRLPGAGLAAAEKPERDDRVQLPGQPLAERGPGHAVHQAEVLPERLPPLLGHQAGGFLDQEAAEPIPDAARAAVEIHRVSLERAHAGGARVVPGPLREGLGGGGGRRHGEDGGEDGGKGQGKGKTARVCVVHWKPRMSHDGR